MFIASSFLIMIYIKPATLTRYLPGYIKPFFGLLTIWIIVSLLGDKYNVIKKKKRRVVIPSILRINFFILGISLIFIYLFNRFQYSRSIVFGTIFIATVLELFIAFVFNIQHNMAEEKQKENEELNAVTSNILSNKETIITDNKHNRAEIDLNDSILSGLRKTKYFKKNTDVFNFISENIPLNKLFKSKSAIMNTHTLFNIENFEEGSQQLFINLHKLNDQRRLNQYFIQVNNNLEFGAYFVCWGNTIAERYNLYHQSFAGPIASILYFVDSLIHRVLPKIPILKEIFFAITKGENRLISEAEILGRLIFCGFKIVETKEINNALFCIVQKAELPRKNVVPSYGPLIKLRRVGKNKEILHIFKFRTMHPYSEFLQKYIHDKYQLEDGGKFKNDFRITGWGKMFRKLWIDELPQFINFFRGEINLVGIRALSEHYFNLYPTDVQELRVKYKPGLVPPFYVDMPVTFDEIVESERIYLLKKGKHPFITDIRYFFVAWFNIIFRHARSN
jgi:hypothetical protein